MLIEAVVIKVVPTREHDRLVTLYSKQLGKLSAVAKGAARSKSIQALQLDPGNVICCELVASKNSWPIITGAQSLKCFSRMKSQSQAWAAAQFFLQIVDLIVFDQEPDQNLWGGLLQALADLDQTQAILTAFRQQQSNILEILGYGRMNFNHSESRPMRTELDDFFERLADRRLKSLDLFYELAG